MSKNLFIALGIIEIKRLNARIHTSKTINKSKK